MAHLLVNAEQLRQPEERQFVLSEWIETAPFEDLLGMTIEHARHGEAHLSLPFRVKHANGGGVMHGGVLVALADTAVAMAIKSLLPEGAIFATTELKMQFVAPLRSGRVFARARVTGPEGRTFLGSAELFDEQEALVASFLCVFRVARGQALSGPGNG
jgi:uncharacterized protein (TIGR00369 family)